MKTIVVYQLGGHAGIDYSNATNTSQEGNDYVSIEGSPAYASRTRGQYTRVAGIEHAGAPVYKRSGWSLYKRSNGRWYLDFNEVDESWSGTVNYALHASDTPFTATWNSDMKVVPIMPRTGFELQVQVRAS